MVSFANPQLALMFASACACLLRLGRLGAILRATGAPEIHKVTKEQMDSIIASMTDPVNGKDGEAFDALDFALLSEFK